MPYIQIFEAQQRSSEETEIIIREVSEAYAKAGALPLAKVQVVIIPVERGNWGVGGKTLQTQDHETR